MGKIVKESNARFVKWSDGSMSLHLGSEIFDVYKQPLQGDHNHLYIRQGTGLQGQAVFRTKLSFRPHSTESFTHRKMTMSLADRSQKTSGIKVLSQVGMNPDQNRYEMIKVLQYFVSTNNSFDRRYVNESDPNFVARIVFILSCAILCKHTITDFYLERGREITHGYESSKQNEEKCRRHQKY